MTGKGAEQERSMLWRSLQVLSQGKGVWRPDLLELLDGGLSELKSYWAIKPQRGLAAARRTISANIHALVAQLEPCRSNQQLTPERRAEQYEKVVLTYFNAVRDGSELQDMNLSQRRAWLAEEGRKPLKVSIRTGQRFFEHALTQIEQLLMDSRYRPIAPSDGEQLDPTQDAEPSSSTESVGRTPVSDPVLPSLEPQEPRATGNAAPVERLLAEAPVPESSEVTVDDLAVSLAMRRYTTVRGWRRMTYLDFIVEYTDRTGDRDDRGEVRKPKEVSARARRALADLKERFDARFGTAKMRNAARRARWTSPTAYGDLDLDSPEGVRDMYRLMMEEAAEAVYTREMTVTEVVSILRDNTQRPDISGFDPVEMAEQVQLSSDRLWRILKGKAGNGGLQGRVIDENGQVVEGLQQATGVRLDTDGHAVAASLISDSEIDNWMRGALEHTRAMKIVSARPEAVRVLSSHMRERLERAIDAEQQDEEYAVRQAEEFGGNSPEAVESQQALARAERETKRQLAAIDACHEAMRHAPPENVRYMTENVFEHDISMGAAGYMNIRQLIERFRDDEEFKQYRS